MERLLIALCRQGSCHAERCAKQRNTAVLTTLDVLRHATTARARQTATAAEPGTTACSTYSHASSKREALGASRDAWRVPPVSGHCSRDGGRPELHGNDARHRADPRNGHGVGPRRLSTLVHHPSRPAKCASSRTARWSRRRLRPSRPFVSAAECGVIGLAFDPDFANNGFVYFFVTVSSSEQQIIRYTANGNIGSDKTTIVAGLATLGGTHNGGAVGFGPDGKLYFAVGDNSVTGDGDSGPELDLRQGFTRQPRRKCSRRQSVFRRPGAERGSHLGTRIPKPVHASPSNRRRTCCGSTWSGRCTSRSSSSGQARTPAGPYLENKQPQGYITPVVAYQTNGVDAYRARAERRDTQERRHDVQDRRRRIGSDWAARSPRARSIRASTCRVT